MYEIRRNDSPHTLIMKYSSNSLWLFFHPVILSEFVKLKMCISGQLLGKNPRSRGENPTPRPWWQAAAYPPDGHVQYGANISFWLVNNSLKMKCVTCNSRKCKCTRSICASRWRRKEIALKLDQIWCCSPLGVQRRPFPRRRQIHF